MEGAAKILGAANFDFESSAIIRPPADVFKNIPNKYTRVCIDSRDRDKNSYPNSNKYVLHLDNEIEDVVSGEIILIQIPFSNYMINKNNNRLFVSVSDTNIDTEVVLEIGDYDKMSLQNELNVKLSPFDIIVSYNVRLDKFIFQGTGSFKLKFMPNNCLPCILGFSDSKLEYVSDSTNTITSLYRLNLNCDNSIIMFIETMNIIVSSNNHVNKCTYIVSRNDNLLNTKSNVIPIKKYFNPLIPRLTKLTLKFTDPYGNLYDFQNQDHRIEILFESKKQLNKYSSYV